MDELPEDPTATYSPGPADETKRSDPSSSATMVSRWSVLAPDSSEAEADTHSSAAPQTTPPKPPAPQRPSYLLHRRIGSGGFGEVWEATQSSLGRRIAVKRLRPNLHQNQPSDKKDSAFYEEAFRREATVTGRLEHPNIVPVHDLGMDDGGRPLLAMKLVRGTPWHRLIARDADMPANEFLVRHLEILMDVAQAVGFAHSRGVIHRDIKPSQVMVGEFGEVLLMDWGLAAVYDADLLRGEGEDSAALTGTESYIPFLDSATNPSGTPSFMAPEQTGRDPLACGPWTDIYLLGGTLYFLLTRSVPHEGEDAVTAFRQAMDEPVLPPGLKAGEREVPRELADLCMWALRRDPAQRPRTVGDFIQGIRDYESGHNRRIEAHGLTDQVARKLLAPSRTYEELAECDTLLTRALTLFPDNPSALVMRELTLREFTEKALEHGDLTLAQAEARRMEDSDEKTYLVQRIQSEEVRTGRRQRWRRYLLRAVTVSVLALGVWLVALSLESGVKLFDARNERDRALKVAELHRRESARIRQDRDLASRLRELAVQHRASTALPAFQGSDAFAVPPPGAEGLHSWRQVMDEIRWAVDDRRDVEKLSHTLVESSLLPPTPFEVELAAQLIAIDEGDGRISADPVDRIQAILDEEPELGFLAAAISQRILLSHPDSPGLEDLSRIYHRSATLASESVEERARDTLSIAGDHLAAGDFALAEELAALTLRGDQLQSAAPAAALDAQELLGFIRFRRGRYESALASLQAFRDLLPSDDPGDGAPRLRRLSALHRLALTYDALGEYETAAALHSDARAALDPGSDGAASRRLAIGVGLARNFLARGLVDQAVAGLDRFTGNPDFPAPNLGRSSAAFHVAESEAALAQGQAEVASRKAQSALQALEDGAADFDELLLEARVLAASADSPGTAAEAVRSAIVAFEEARAEPHPAAAIARTRLASLLLAADDVEGARGESSSAARQLLGDPELGDPARHPATARALVVLAESCTRSGDCTIARDLLLAAFAAQRARLGGAHPDTVETGRLLLDHFHETSARTREDFQRIATLGDWLDRQPRTDGSLWKPDVEARLRLERSFYFAVSDFPPSGSRLAPRNAARCAALGDLLRLAGDDPLLSGLPDRVADASLAAGASRLWPDTRAPLGATALHDFLDGAAAPLDWRAEFSGFIRPLDDMLPPAPGAERLGEILEGLAPSALPPAASDSTGDPAPTLSARSPQS